MNSRQRKMAYFRYRRKLAQENNAVDVANEFVKYLEGEGSTITTRILNPGGNAIELCWTNDLERLGDFRLRIFPNDNEWYIYYSSDRGGESKKLGNHIDVWNMIQGYDDAKDDVRAYNAVSESENESESEFTYDVPEVYNITPFGVVKEVD